MLFLLRCNVTLRNKEGYQEFLLNEARYSALTRSFPERAQELFAKNEESAKATEEEAPA